MKKSILIQEQCTGSQWIVYLNLYKEISQPTWFINEKVGIRILVKSRKLPIYEKGVPSINGEGFKNCTLINPKGTAIHCCNGFIVIYGHNLIEIRKDNCFTIENYILKSAPDKIYREVCHFL